MLSSVEHEKSFLTSDPGYIEIYGINELFLNTTVVEMRRDTADS